jgi:RNA recognition motif-containing protein
MELLVLPDKLAGEFLHPSPPRLVADDILCDRLYVGSLNFALTESDIREVFQPFGPVEIVDLHKDVVTGKSKGYAFVQFVSTVSLHLVCDTDEAAQVQGTEGCCDGA